MSYRILKDDKSYYAQVECPGYKREEIDISVENKNIVIKGNRKDRMEKEDGKYHQTGCYWINHRFGLPSLTGYDQFGFGSFRKEFHIDTNALDTTRIEAKLEDGILIVTIPIKESSMSRKIAISA